VHSWCSSCGGGAGAPGASIAATCTASAGGACHFWSLQIQHNIKLTIPSKCKGNNVKSQKADSKRTNCMLHAEVKYYVDIAAAENQRLFHCFENCKLAHFFSN